MTAPELTGWSSSAPLLTDTDHPDSEKHIYPPHCHSPHPGSKSAHPVHSRANSRRTALFFIAGSFVTLLILLYTLLGTSPCLETSRSRCYRGFESDWSFDAATLSKNKWMSALPDTVNVSALSIPGTHDTMTYTVDDIRLQCQNINLTSQLHAGIRYIDGRTRLQGDTLAIYHASQATGHTLQDLFTTLFTFLTENPSEAIILRIKEEGPRIGDGSLTFQQAFHKLQTTNPDLSWSFTQHIYTPKKLSALPTLGQLRGKILILQEFPAATDYGVRWRSTQITLEDLWIIPSLAHLELKWTAIRDALVRSASVPADENESLYISHLSASVGVLPIEAAAGSRDGLFKGMNDRTGEWLGTQDVGRRGIVIMDFPGAPLVDAIIGQNRDLFV